MLELLYVFKQGSTYDDALEQVYSFDTAGLDDAWRLSLALNPRDGEPTPQISPTPKPPGGFLQCRESLGQTSGSNVMVFAALGLLLLPGLGEFIRLRARRGKR
jgi:predicted RNase H-like HicB family nuclease